MQRFLLALVLVLASALPSLAQAPKMHADAAYGVAYVQTRITELPQDQDKPYLTVIGDPSDTHIKMVTEWFKTNADLKAIKDQCHFVAMPTSGNSKPARFYQQRYAKTVEQTPCIRFQQADGTMIVELTANDIPATPEALVNALNRPAAQCFGRRQNNNNCQPQPNPAPDTDPAPAPLDRRGPAPKPAAIFPWLLLIAVSMFGAGVGVAQKYHETYSKQ